MDEADKIRKVIDLEEAAFPALQQAVGKTLDTWLSAVKADAKTLEREFVPDVDQDIVDRTYEVMIASFMLGMSHVAPGSSDFADAVPKPLSFDEAVAFSQGRISLTRDDYYQVSDALRARAWTVGRLAQLDAVERARTHYLAQLKGDASGVEPFVQSLDLDGAMGASGWASGQAGYYETVYRTNIQSDYNAGRAQQFKNNPPALLEFIGIEDARQTDICARRTGTVLPPDDPWWEANWPPLHYNCRSTVRAIYADEAAGYDLSKLSPPSPEYAKPAQGSFGHNPIKDNALWNVTPAQQARISRAMIQEELNGVVGQTVCKDFAKAKAGLVSMEVSKGGVRYPDTMGKSAATSMAADLANDKGWYVELTPDGNAWVNGMDRWALTRFDGKPASIGSLFEQARSAYLEVPASKASSIAAALARALVDVSARREISLLAVNIGGRIVYLTMDHVRYLRELVDQGEREAFIASLL